jgi:ATP-dependent Clp protease protease subunit
MSSWFSINHVGGETFVTLTDGIGSFGIGFKNFEREFSNSNPTKVFLTVDSDGGSCDVAEQVFNLLKGHDTEVFIRRAHSAAFIVMLAGKKISVAHDGILMTHRSILSVLGQAEDLRKSADRLDALDVRLNQIIADRTGQSIETVEGWHQDGDRYFTPEEALSLGIVHAIADKPVPAVVKPHVEEVTDSAVGPKAPTEQEKLFATFLNAFGKMTVSNKAEFGKTLHEFLITQVIQA